LRAPSGFDRRPCEASARPPFYLARPPRGLSKLKHSVSQRNGACIALCRVAVPAVGVRIRAPARQQVGREPCGTGDDALRRRLRPEWVEIGHCFTSEMRVIVEVF
jgi:hypothetical protein